MSNSPLIIYVPGLLPKPEAGTHREALLRCLLAGVQRIDGHLAKDIASCAQCFDIVAWTYDFYGQHRDFGLDAAAVDAVVARAEATQRDRDDASSWLRRIGRRLYSLGDRLPFLIPHIATERMELHLRDLRRYVKNRKGIAEHTRQMLKTPLLAAYKSGRPILLIAHSMGSVIAYEALWQLSREDNVALQIDLFLTMGSPLGQRYIQKRIKGNKETGARRYPDNLRGWINLSSVGDLTAIDPVLRDDFGEMTEFGLVDAIDDREIYNWFRLNGVLNTHSEYGYLANGETARIIVDWWRAVVGSRHAGDIS
jgi:hypothetical protein